MWSAMHECKMLNYRISQQNKMSFCNIFVPQEIIRDYYYGLFIVSEEILVIAR